MTLIVDKKPEAKNEGEEKPTATSAGSEGEKTAATAASQAAEGEKATITTRTFSQEEVNALVGNARQEARDRTAASTLKDLGFDDLDKAKTAISAFEKHRQAQLTELEQAQEKLGNLEGFDERFEASDKKVKELEKLIEAQVAAMVKSMEIPDHVKPLLEAMPVQERLSYLTEHGDKFIKQQTVVPNSNAGSKGGGNSADNKSQKDKIRAKYGILY